MKAELGSGGEDSPQLSEGEKKEGA